MFQSGVGDGELHLNLGVIFIQWPESWACLDSPCRPDCPCPGTGGSAPPGAPSPPPSPSSWGWPGGPPRSRWEWWCLRGKLPPAGQEPRSWERLTSNKAVQYSGGRTQSSHTHSQCPAQSSCWLPGELHSLKHTVRWGTMNNNNIPCNTHVGPHVHPRNLPELQYRPLHLLGCKVKMTSGQIRSDQISSALSLSWSSDLVSQVKLRREACSVC